jgi:High-affinity nickel-transport protein/Nitrile hydratase beta subunit
MRAQNLPASMRGKPGLERRAGMMPPMRSSIPDPVPALGEEPIFRPGDRIRISNRFPLRHYRVPLYLRGKTGTAEVVIEPAAIDNVSRKLMQENKRPVSVGFFFAMGHSAVVTVVATVVAAASTMLGGFESFRDVGGVISTGVSARFLLAIAAMNLVIFFSIHKSYRRVRVGGAYVEEDAGSHFS